MSLSMIFVACFFFASKFRNVIVQLMTKLYLFKYSYRGNVTINISIIFIFLFFFVVVVLFFVFRLSDFP